MVILEAMASGLPVVASNVGDVCRMVEDGVTGYVLPTGDVNTLRDRISKILEDSGLAHRMGNAGRLAVKRFSSRNMANTYLDIYRGIIAE